MLIVALVFDPTKKMVLASMCFEELYREDNLEGKDMYESVVSVLRSFFKEYSERHGRASGGKSDQAKTSNTQSSECSREMSMITPELVDDDIGYKRIDRRYKSMSCPRSWNLPWDIDVSTET